MSNTENDRAELQGRGCHVPECAHPDGHVWVLGRPVFESEDCERVPENVAYNTRQCRRCGFHNERDPRPTAQEDSA